MRGGGLALVVVAALFSGAGGCGPDTVTLPTPPKAEETAQLVALYQMPTATLDKTNIDQVRASAQAKLAELNLDWLPTLLSDVLARERKRLEAAGLSVDPNAAAEDERFAGVTAVANVNRICAGWDDPAGPPDQAANGAVQVTAIVDSGRLNPELWGTASACKARFSPESTGAAIGSETGLAVTATLDGTLIIYSLGPLPTSAIDAQFLVSFEGMIGVGDKVRSASFDFELVNGSVKFRVPVESGGDAIVTVGVTLGIQGANAGFSCTLTTLTCESTG